MGRHWYAGVAAVAFVLLATPLSASTALAPAPPAPHVLVALGDSITSAWGSGVDASGAAVADDNQAASWATGTDPAVASHARRTAALFGAQPASVNLARAGRRVVDDDGIGYQASIAPAGTDDVLIETGSSDLCAQAVTSVDAMTPVADFEAAVKQALQTIATRFPTAHVLVASIPNWYGLWATAPPYTRPTTTCPLLFSADPAIANTTSRVAVQQRTIAYNGALAEACAAFANCRYDGGAVYAIALQPTDLSTYDHFHPSVAGQAKLAAATWPVSWWGGDVAPAVLAPPAITGIPSVGTTLTAANGSWTGSPAPVLTRQWLRCATSGCAPVPGATAATYVPVAADVGSTIAVRETATNTAGSLDSVSAPTAAVVPRATAPPTTLTLPTVTGVARVNQTLSATNGSWGNNPTGYIGQWLRCTSAGACTAIGGATSGVYTVVAADVGNTIRFQLTAYNAAGSTAATSVPTSVVTQLANPLSLDVLFENPAVFPLAVDRNGVAYGTSSSATDPRNRLYRSYDEGRTWAPVADLPEGTAIVGMSVLSSNTLIASVNVLDEMHLFRSADGGVTWTDVFQFLEGYQTLGAHSIGSDGTFAYLGSYNVLDAGDHVNWIWRSADDGQTWTIVRTTTSHRHVHFVQVDPAGVVYAGYGDSPAQSAIERSTDHGTTWQTLCSGPPCVAVDIAFDPSGFAIFGTDHPSSASFVTRVDLTSGAVLPVAGLPGASYSSLNLGNGVWLVGTTHEPTGVTAPGDTTVHLFGSNDGGATFSDVFQRPFAPDGASVLTVQFAFPGSDFPISIAQAGGGTIVARVHSTRPISTGLPTVTGSRSTGATLTATPGTWTSSAVPAFAYQWQRCPASGVCVDIAGARAATYVPGAADVGQTLRARVTATNTGGSTPAASVPTTAIVDAGIAVTSSIVAGQQLSGKIAWTATVSSVGRTVARVVFSIDGRALFTDTTSPYAFGSGLDTTTLADGTHVFTITAVATDGLAATTTASAVVVNVKAPVNTALPQVLGTTWVGGYLGALPGTWTHAPTSYDLQWQRCDARGNGCTPIRGATSLLYRVVAADVGTRLRISVTARNSAGSTTAFSNPTAAITRTR